MKWARKHGTNLDPVLPRRVNNNHVHKPRILQDINYRSGILGQYILDDK
jgi:hypothetical protein